MLDYWNDYPFTNRTLAECMKIPFVPPQPRPSLRFTLPPGWRFRAARVALRYTSPYRLQINLQAKACPGALWQEIASFDSYSEAREWLADHKLI